MVLFIGILTVVIGGIHFYLWSRLVRSPDLGPMWTRYGGYAFTALALLLPVGMMLTRTLPRPISTVVAALVYGWMGLSILLLILTVPTELVRAGFAIQRLTSTEPVDPERRAFVARLLAGAVGVGALALGGVGLAAALGKVGIQPVRVSLARLPKSLSGFKIAQLTDLHIGATLGADWLTGVVAEVNELKPDLVVITGDLVDGSVAELREQVAPLAKLSAKHGVFFVTGNHEYYSGADEWIAELGRLGVRVLRNEHVSIGEGAESFDLAGVDDLSAGRFGHGHGADVARAVAGRDPSRELVLLAHQPKQILEAALHGVGLQLSGHTHGGQIFPWNLFVRLDQPYVAGLARHGDAQIYVSRGTGFWGPPLRVGAPSEIALVELHAA